LSMVTVDLDPNLWMIRAVMLARGVTMAFALLPLQASAYANVDLSDTGRATAIYSVNRQIAASFGVAILATVFVEVTAHLVAGASGPGEVAAGTLDAFRVSFLVSSLLALVAIVPAMLIRDRDAASTIRRYAEVTPTTPPTPTPAAAD
jgi:hypothetical protein